jgi:hypothetical protein
VARILIGGKPHRAGFHALAHQLFHLGDFFRRRFSLHRLLAHDVVAHGDMSDQSGGVNAETGAEGAEIFAGRGPLPFHAFFENATADRFNAHKAFDHRLAIFRLGGREAQTAVADHHRSDAVKAR